ncbi:MAG: hypothetical protein DRI93_03235 [Aquificota bacterium]|nr:MAG: hypothetical protein DRJ03_14800 [Chloroflexota bacterium]RLD94920.1 MAG: hypothetical protein DRI93_03235 [Aquificota bacterium]
MKVYIVLPEEMKGKRGTVEAILKENDFYLFKAAERWIWAKETHHSDPKTAFSYLRTIEEEIRKKLEEWRKVEGYNPADHTLTYYLHI